MERLRSCKLFDQRGVSHASSDVLKGKAVFLYFSAHWCPPCRQFTPVLKSFYNSLKSKGDPFEIIFVSNDKSSEEAKNYFRNDHGDYYMIDFESNVRAELSSELGVSGIPALILVDSKGVEKASSNECRQLVIDFYQKKDVSAKLTEMRKAVGDWTSMKGTALGSSDGKQLSREELRKLRMDKFAAQQKKEPEGKAKLKALGYSQVKVDAAWKDAEGDYDTALGLLMSED